MLTIMSSSTESLRAPVTPSRWAEVRSGVAVTLGAGLGLFPLGMAFGMLVVQAGLPAWVAPLFSVVVFAGSVELLLVSLVVAGTPLLTIAVTVFLVNFRHVFYAFSFPLRVVRGRFARIYSMGALIDEAYAIAAARPRGWTGPRLVAMQVALHAYWVLGGLAGVAVAWLLPGPVEGLEFALVALFIVLAMDAARTRAQLPLVLAAAVAVGVALLLVPAQVLVVAFALYAAVLIAFHVLAARGTALPLPEPVPVTGPVPVVAATGERAGTDAEPGAGEDPR
ncbi:branched-chain amino acid ABC transporter permease [Micrococcus luteus]|nr:branched-chain amino acid ABC transporter permease [Micrococcus luteus]